MANVGTHASRNFRRGLTRHAAEPVDSAMWASASATSATTTWITLSGVARDRLLAAAALELIALVREEDIEAGQRAVTAADVTLELDLLCLR